MTNQPTLNSLYPAQSFKLHWVLQIGCLLFLAGLLFSGCGSGGPSSTGEGSKVGSMTITIDWPVSSGGNKPVSLKEKGAVREKIPSLTQSVQVKLIQGSLAVVADCVTRQEGQTSVTKTYDKIPEGQTLVNVEAFPSGDCTEVAISTASANVTVVANQAVSVSLAMTSTITHVEVTPNPFQLIVGGTVGLTATPKNNNGQVVLVPTSGWTWTSSDATKATVCATKTNICTVTGVAATDLITISATENEFGIVGTSTGKVLISGGSTLSTGDWPQLGHDAANTGVAEFSLEPPLKARWTYSGSTTFTAPVAAGGKVYMGGSDGKVYAIDITTGGIVWTYNTNSTSCCSYIPGVENGILFLQYDSGSTFNVLAIDSNTGSKKWEVPISGYISEEMVIAGGIVYVFYYNNAGHLLALDATDGTQKFDIVTTGGSGPFAVAGGVIYVAGYEFKALDAATGTTKWTYSESGNEYFSWPYVSPVVSGGVVYGAYRVVGENSELVAMDALNGTQKWKTSISSTAFFYGAHLAVSGGIVYASYSDKLFALDAANGTKKWEIGVTSSFGYYVPLLAVSGNILYNWPDNKYGSYNNSVDARDTATGVLKWSYSTSPTGIALAGGVLLITSSSYTTGSKIEAFEPVTNGGSVNITIN